MTDSPTDNAKKPRKPRGTKRVPGKRIPTRTRPNEAQSGKKSTRTRKSTKNYLSYEEARDYIRSEMITSRANYETWFQATKPKVIPRFPYRYYDKKGWVSWNEFLGVTNEFIGKKVAKWRPYEEAVAWVHQLKLRTYEDWIAFAKTDKLPEDIPKRPDVVYNKRWLSWNYWLGYRPSDKIAATKEGGTAIFYIIKERSRETGELSHPGNVLTFGIQKLGLSALKNAWTKTPYDIVKIFKYDEGKGERVNQIIEALSTPYHGYTKVRIVPNVWEILWYLSMELEVITNYQEAAVYQREATVVESDRPLADSYGLMPIDED